jgi:glycosyltransferase involved in cell wall biosynthesis
MTRPDNVKSKPAILFMAQIPPPVHGAALRNQSLLESKLLNAEFEFVPLPLRFIDDMRDLGKFSFKKIAIALMTCFRMISIIIGQRIDAVYFTMSPSGGAFYRDLFFIAVMKLFRKKRILHFRVKGLKKTGSSALGKRLVRFGLSGADIICLSQHHKTDLEGLHLPNLHVVPNGIKVEQAFLEAFGGRRKPNSPCELMFLSNLSKKKGVPELIEAMVLLRKRNYNFHLTVVGAEWDITFDQLKKELAQEGLQDQVTIAGPKFGKDKFEAIGAADIFIFPTYFELFPGVILEAMQFGKAIVSTFEGSIPEMIDNGVNGLLVRQQNSTELADAIASLIDDPEKIELMGSRAQQKFFDCFTLEAFELNMKRTFETILHPDGRIN